MRKYINELAEMCGEPHGEKGPKKKGKKKPKKKGELDEAVSVKGLSRDVRQIFEMTKNLRKAMSSFIKELDATAEHTAKTDPEYGAELKEKAEILKDGLTKTFVSLGDGMEILGTLKLAKGRY
jgi:hypothetical protein